MVQYLKYFLQAHKEIIESFAIPFIKPSKNKGVENNE